MGKPDIIYEDNDIIRIKQSITKYKPRQQNVATKRALTAQQIRAIFHMPYSGLTVRGYQCRRDLARDCFILSFCLMGMNSADLYNATEIKGEYITYTRTKTKDRRNDNARMGKYASIPQLNTSSRNTAEKTTFSTSPNASPTWPTSTAQSISA